ncbi:hypothetical protein AB0F20_05695 [Streptomyces goshikiensis]|uniref:hypothetical protein n=1 Tax=Streptomyces goshikiensis TaxID=1942 RepID=UPI0033EDC69B
MTAAVAAAAKARVFLLFVGVASLLGLDWSAWDRIVVGLAIIVAVAVEVGLDGHRVWPRRLRTVQPQRHPTA